MNREALTNPVKRTNSFMSKKLLVAFSLLALSSSLSAQSAPFVHPEGKYVEVNGTKLWVETVGTGDPLFLISGGPGGSHVGLHSFDRLQDSCTLVFVDNFGRGKSDTAKNVKEYTISRDVEDIEGIRKALGYDKINILGHSYGSVVAQLYAIKYGDHIKHLIIADGFFSGKMWQENDDNSNHEIMENYPEIWDSLMHMRKHGLISSDKAFYTEYGNVPYGFLYAYNPTNFLHGLDPSYPNRFNLKLYYQLVGPDGDFVVGNDIAKFDVTKELKNLKMPVLIVAGRYDRVSVPKWAVMYKQYCPQAQFVMFEHSGHNPMVEEPEKEFPIIRAFLKN
ncbi:MAG TPA: alpha/beta hydrolase [Bacteroidia bacterium]|jgi:proline iminopeptidase|nr:alpha/beta hydrolase [Bacteroidia bacterium]